MSHPESSCVLLLCFKGFGSGYESYRVCCSCCVLLDSVVPNCVSRILSNLWSLFLSWASILSNKIKSEKKNELTLRFVKGAAVAAVDFDEMRDSQRNTGCR